MAKKKSANPTPAEVWSTLSAINVNEHTETKMNLTYLSWAWAWITMKENYPQMRVTWRGSHEIGGKHHDSFYYPDGSASVMCTVSIGPDVQESMWLPVMDNRNNAIANPNSRQVSDAKMRCLVKCFAVLGLGCYIYAGEDIPSASAPIAKPKPVDDGEVKSALADLKSAYKEAVARGVTFSAADKSNMKAAVDSKEVMLIKAMIDTITATESKEA